MKKFSLFLTALVCSTHYFNIAIASPCSFDQSKDCTLFKDVLNDISLDGLYYYAPTNYDHRNVGGESSVFDASMVTPYVDDYNVPGQLNLAAKKINGAFKSGEIMTRKDLHSPPFNAPVKSFPFTTQDIKHGYIEVTLKMPKCDISDDGLCQKNNAPESYSRGLWPYVWLMPTTEKTPHGQLNLLDGYKELYGTNLTLSSLHFDGKSGECHNNDCKSLETGYLLPPATTTQPLYDQFHKWGFEWESDPTSEKGGVLLSEYFDDVKIWGPVRSDYLPGEGTKALREGFNDALGGYYLVVALAVGGPYVGEPNTHLISANMNVQSVKAFSVVGNSVTEQPRSATCFPPTNIVYEVSPDNKQVTFVFDSDLDEGDLPIRHRVYNYLHQLIWENKADENTVIDNSIANVPGPGQYPYYFATTCDSGNSKSFRKTVTIK